MAPQAGPLPPSTGLPASLDAVRLAARRPGPSRAYTVVARATDTFVQRSPEMFMVSSPTPSALRAAHDRAATSVTATFALLGRDAGLWALEWVALAHPDQLLRVGRAVPDAAIDCAMVNAAGLVPAAALSDPVVRRWVDRHLAAVPPEHREVLHALAPSFPGNLSRLVEVAAATVAEPAALAPRGPSGTTSGAPSGEPVELPAGAAPAPLSDHPSVQGPRQAG